MSYTTSRRNRQGSAQGYMLAGKVGDKYTRYDVSADEARRIRAALDQATESSNVMPSSRVSPHNSPRTTRNTRSYWESPESGRCYWRAKNPFQCLPMTNRSQNSAVSSLQPQPLTRRLS